MRALITGAAGQDGTLLSRMLLQRGYEVIGVVKPGQETKSYLELAPGARVVECDLADLASVRRLVPEFQPDEVYSLGGITTVAEAQEDEDLTRRVLVEAVEVLLDTAYRSPREVRVVQAGSALVFEGGHSAVQTEETPPSPISAYARAKAESMERVRDARQRGQFAGTAILYNHESPLRDTRFVTRKISRTAAQIAYGTSQELVLGDLSVRRDWGWAPDYVQGMWLMARAAAPADYIFSTGIQSSVKDFAMWALQAARVSDWERVLIGSEDLHRPVDPTLLRGDSARAYADLGWSHTISVEGISREMVRHDLALLDDPAMVWIPDAWWPEPW